MEQTSISSEAYNRLLDAIFPIILKNGMKATTMDKVAACLSMSKRTLYEIFDSKEEMLKQVIRYSHKKHIENLCRIFKEADTVMEAFYLTLKTHQSVMGQASAAFYQDMDSSYARLRPVYDNQSDTWQRNMLKAIDDGIKQGVFRSDVNYPILLRMFRIQMESLKRMEEFLPQDVTLNEAFDTISISFLRSIASQEGAKILERIKNSYS